MGERRLRENTEAEKAAGEEGVAARGGWRVPVTEWALPGPEAGPPPPPQQPPAPSSCPAEEARAAGAKATGAERAVRALRVTAGNPGSGLPQASPRCPQTPAAVRAGQVGRKRPRPARSPGEYKPHGSGAACASVGDAVARQDPSHLLPCSGGPGAFTSQSNVPFPPGCYTGRV